MSFGTQPTGGFGTSTPAFGGFGAAQPRPQQQQFSFGGQTAPAAATAPSTFGSFGAPAANTGLFGAFGAKTTATPSFGFGTATTTNAPSGSFGFGTGTSTSTPSFSFGGGGAAAAPAAATTTTGTFGGFGTNPTSAFGAFGSGTQAPATGGFGAFSGSLFAKPTATAPATAGATTSSGFGTMPTSNAFGGFGTGTATTSGFGFGAQQQQQPAQAQSSQMAMMISALTSPSIFGDERDALLAKWNQLQAFWETGRGYVNQQMFVDFSTNNPFCRFKAIGYSCIPSMKSEEGLVALILSKNSTEIRTNQQQLIDSLFKLLGSKPTVQVHIDSINRLPEEKTEVVIYVIERMPSGTSRKVSTQELSQFFAANKSNLQLLSVIDIISLSTLNREQIQNYLSQPPLGIDPILWEQAKQDNPDSDKFMPVPMVGFSELRSRLKSQQEETTRHEKVLTAINNEIMELQRKQSSSVARLEEYKRKHIDLSHRVLKVLVKLEVYRKSGFSIQPDEEQLRIKLEQLNSVLNAPSQLKGRLNELLSQVRLHFPLAGAGSRQLLFDETSMADVKQFLREQQEGLKQLVGIINEDFEDLKKIQNDIQLSFKQIR